MSRGRIRQNRRNLLPGDVSRWSLLGKAMKKADKQGEALGHWLAPWQIDDPESPTDNRITHCRKCDRVAAVDIEEGEFPIGAALTQVCDVVVYQVKASADSGRLVAG